MAFFFFLEREKGLFVRSPDPSGSRIQVYSNDKTKKDAFQRLLLF